MCVAHETKLRGIWKTNYHFHEGRGFSWSRGKIHPKWKLASMPNLQFLKFPLCFKIFSLNEGKNIKLFKKLIILTAIFRRKFYWYTKAWPRWNSLKLLIHESQKKAIRWQDEESTKKRYNFFSKTPKPLTSHPLSQPYPPLLCLNFFFHP